MCRAMPRASEMPMLRAAAAERLGLGRRGPRRAARRRARLLEHHDDRHRAPEPHAHERQRAGQRHPGGHAVRAGRRCRRRHEGRRGARPGGFPAHRVRRRDRTRPPRQVPVPHRPQRHRCDHAHDVWRTAGQPPARRLVTQMADETTRVVHAERQVARAPDGATYGDKTLTPFVLPEAAAHRSSMPQDAEAGRRTEIDYLNGAAVRTGQGAGHRHARQRRGGEPRAGQGNERRGGHLRVRRSTRGPLIEAEPERMKWAAAPELQHLTHRRPA